jgi:hypothetical protein
MSKCGVDCGCAASLPAFLHREKADAPSASRDGQWERLMEEAMGDNAAAVRYILKKHFDSDVTKLSKVAEIPVQTLKQYINDEVEPNASTTEFIMHLAYTPEFSIICEFARVPLNVGTAWIATILGGHASATGIYAFYDSMARLSYLGKAATNLSGEIYSAMTRSYVNKMPSGINDVACQRRDVIHYMSAYRIKAFDSWDYTKHVESLILRISNPPMNKQSGTLARAFSDKK